MTCDIEFLHPGQFYTRLLLKNERRSIVRVFVDQQIQYLKCRVFIVVLLSMGNIKQKVFNAIFNAVFLFAFFGLWK